MRWNGRAWQQAPLPFPGASLTGTAQTPWVLLDEDASAPLAQWTGRAWRLVQVPGVKGKWVQLSAVVPTRSGEFWALGMVTWDEEDWSLEPSPVTRPLCVRLTWDAGRWSCFFGHTDEGGRAGFTDVVHDGRGGLWALTHDDELWHLTEGRWTRERPHDAGDTMNRKIVELAASEDGRHVYALGSAVWRLSR